MVPIESRATALLALTGDTDFVKDLKGRARRMGLEVNEWGLWKSLHSPTPTIDSPSASGVTTTTTTVGEVARQRGRPKGSVKDREERGEKGGSGGWEKIQVETEEEVLNELGMGWVEPARRNFGLLASATTGGVRVR
jgi:DNA polymerase beta